MVTRKGGTEAWVFVRTKVTSRERKSLDLAGYGRWKYQNILILAGGRGFFGARLAKRERESLGLIGFDR